MKEYSGYVSAVDLDGPDGDAWVVVKCRVSVPDARKLARLMIAQGYPIRALFPETAPSGGGGNDG
jgi:hypothetical protein